MKKLLLLVVNVILVLPSLGQDFTYEYEGQRLSYTILDELAKVVTVAKVEEPIAGDLIIPSEVNGYKVISIDPNAFSHCTNLTSVSIPHTVKYIGASAFEQCVGLNKAQFASIESLCNISFSNSESNPLYFAHCLYLDGKEVQDLVIPNSVESIPRYAFSGCYNLISLNISNSVIYIGDEAFSGCSGLFEVKMGSGIKDVQRNAFYGCSNLMKVEYSSIKSLCSIYFSYSSNPLTIAHHLYVNGEEVKDVVIPESVEYVSSDAFNGGSNINSVTFSNSVTRIGSNAFKDCIGLQEIIIPRSVETIEYEAFSGCKELKKIEVQGDKTKFISGYSFDDYTYRTASLYLPSETAKEYSATNWIRFKNIWFGENYAGQYYSDGVLNYRLIEDPSSPKALIQSGNYSSISELVIPEYVVVEEDSTTQIQFQIIAIGVNAFEDCRELQEVKFPNKSYVSEIGEYAFKGCNKLMTINLPSSLENINKNSFEGCSVLNSIVFPDSVVFIGDYAFSGCKALSAVTLGSSIKTIGRNAFDSCTRIKRVDISNIESFCDINFETNKSNPVYFSRNLYMGGEEVTDVTIPESLDQIKKFTFYKCRSLKSLKIGNSVRSIGNLAFCECCSLAVVSIGPSVSTIGGYAFESCTKLESIKIPASVKKLVIMHSMIAWGCLKLILPV